MLSAASIAGRRLRNSGLTGPPFGSPDQVVAWHGAMQAQDYGPAKWSVGQRANGLVDADLDAAVADGSIIRTHVLRPTWHFVARDDARWLLALTGPRVHRNNRSRYRDLGLDPKTLDRAAKLIVTALQGGNHLTRVEVAAALDKGKVDRTDQRLSFILMHCELEAIICSGVLAGKKTTYAVFDERVPTAPSKDRERALAELIGRYLASHGPATVQDICWWSSLTATDVKAGLEMLGDEVAAESLDDLTFWFMAEKGPAPRASGIHLLQTYDETIVGYTRSRYFGDPNAGAALEVWKARTLPSGVILGGGRIIGHWRPGPAKDPLPVEIRTYETPSAAQTRALEKAAAALGRFKGLPAIADIARL